MFLLGITLGMIGKVLLGVAVIRVHMSVAREHRIDKDVIANIKKERFIGILAIVFIIVGYFLEVFALGLV